MHSIIPDMLLPKLPPTLGIFTTPDKAALTGNTATRARMDQKKARAFYHPVNVRFSTGSLLLFVAPCHSKKLVEYAAMLVMNQAALLHKPPQRIDYVIDDSRVDSTIQTLASPRDFSSNFFGLLGVSLGLPPITDEAGENRILLDKETKRVSVVVSRGTEVLCMLHFLATKEGREKELASFAWRHVQNIYPQTYPTLTLTAYVTP